MLGFVFKEYTVLLFVLAGIMAIVSINRFIKAMNPSNNKVFKKLGNPEKVQQILNNLNKEKIFEDDNLIMLKKYITNKNSLDDLTCFIDVLGIHKLKHSHNGVPDYFEIVLTDKYGDEHHYKYNVQNEKDCDELMVKIASHCPNAALGYTKQQREYIKNNRVKLTDKTDTEEK